MSDVDKIISLLPAPGWWARFHSENGPHLVAIGFRQRWLT